MDSFWSNLLQNNPRWMRKLDYITVKALERKAPGDKLPIMCKLNNTTGNAALSQQATKMAAVYRYSNNERPTGLMLRTEHFRSTILNTTALKGLGLCKFHVIGTCLSCRFTCTMA